MNVLTALAVAWLVLSLPVALAAGQFIRGPK